MTYCKTGSRTWPTEKTTGSLALETVPRSCAKAKTGQLLDTARKLMSWVFASVPLLMNCARTTMSWPVWYVVPDVWRTRGG